MPWPSFVRLGMLALALAVLPARPSLALEDPAHAAPAQVHGETPQEEAANVGHAVADEAHGVQPEGTPNILELKPSLMITTVVVFLTLLAVLWKFAWGPLSEALTERERKHEETVRLAEEARAESARLLAEHKKQMDSAAEQVRQMLDDSRRQADANAQAIASKAQADAEATLARAEREIGTAKDQALNEIWSQTADLAVSVAGKVLSKELSGDDHRRLVAAATAELPSNGHGGHSS